MIASAVIYSLVAHHPSPASDGRFPEGRCWHRLPLVLVLQDDKDGNYGAEDSTIRFRF